MRRYPGTNPFEISQEKLFNGRDDEKSELILNITLNRTLTIHADSGSGKSSIINTKILSERKFGKNEYQPVLINFEKFPDYEFINPSTSNKEVIISHVIKNIKQKYEVLKNLVELPEWLMEKFEDNLWFWDKVFQANSLGLLLIFDQFELLENYTKEQIKYFGQELLRAINMDFPFKEFSKEINLIDSPSKDKFLPILFEKSDLKLVFAIREDKLGVLNLLKYYFPLISSNDYFLKKLSVSGAVEAIKNPGMAEGKFDSPKLKFTDEAIKVIINDLLLKSGIASNENNSQMLTHLNEDRIDNIDPFELQIICAGIENEYCKDGEDDVEEMHYDEIEDDGKINSTEDEVNISVDNLPDFKKIVENFYTRKWLKVDKEFSNLAEYDKCKSHIIRELLKNNIRVKVSQESFNPFERRILEKLGKRTVGLIRKDTVDKINYYQIPHDRLAAPFSIDLKDIEEKERNKKFDGLYRKIIQDLINENNYNKDLPIKIYDFFEHNLITADKTIAKVEESKIPKYLLQIIKTLINNEFISSYVDERGIEFIQLADSSLIGQILKVKDRKTQEKKILKQRQIFISTIIVVVLSFFGYLAFEIVKDSAIKNDHNEKIIAQKRIDSLRDVFFNPALLIEFHNPTLCYQLITEARTVDTASFFIKDFLGKFLYKRPYFVSKRLLDNDYLFAVAGKDTCYQFTDGEITTYNYKHANSITSNCATYKSLNTERILGVRNIGGGIFYMQALPKDDYYLITLNNIRQKIPYTSFKYHKNALPRIVAFTDDRKSVFLDGVIYHTNNTDSLVLKVYDDTKDIMSAAFTHDGKLLMVGYWGGQILVFDVNGKDGKAITGYRGGNFNSVISALEISPDDKFMADGDHSGNVHLWKIKDSYANLKAPKDTALKNDVIKFNYYPFKTLSWHQKAINSIAISQSGKRVISGSDDKTAIVWDIEGNIKAVLRGHRDGVEHVQFTNDTSNIITQSVSGEVLVWAASKPDDLLKMGQLELFDRYDYLSLGIDYKTYHSIVMDVKTNDAQDKFQGFADSVQMLTRELKSLPYVNDYPDNQKFMNSLKNYLAELDNRYSRSEQKRKDYPNFPVELWKKLRIAYLDMLYNKKPALTRAGITENKKQETKNKIEYYKLIISEYERDFRAWNTVKHNLYQYRKRFSQDDFSYKMEKSDANWIEEVFKRYYLKFPEIKIDYSEGLSDLGYIFYNQKNYLAAILEYEKEIGLWGDKKNIKTLNLDFNIIICNLQLNKTEKALNLLDTLLIKYAKIDNIVYTEKVTKSFNKKFSSNFSDEDFSAYYLLDEKASKLNIPTNPPSLAIFEAKVTEMLKNNKIYKALKAN